MDRAPRYFLAQPVGMPSNSVVMDVRLDRRFFNCEAEMISPKGNSLPPVRKRDRNGMNSFQRPLVSVGVVTYNRPDELERTLAYLAAQTYENLEIIISDNASSDARVADVALRFVSTDPRARFVRQQQNIGPNDNFAFVLKEASGELFMWWSDDDHRAPRFIDALVDALTANAGSVIAFPDFNLVDAGGNTLPGYEHRPEKLRLFANPSRACRSMAYFLQHPEWQKQDAIYGLVKRDVAMRSSIAVDTSKIGVVGDDQLLVYEWLQHGPMAISGERLFYLTAGNVKHYDARSVAGRTSLQKIKAELSGMADEFRRAPRYIPRTAGATKIAVALMLPVRYAALLWRAGVIVPWRMFRKRRNGAA